MQDGPGVGKRLALVALVLLAGCAAVPQPPAPEVTEAAAPLPEETPASAAIRLHYEEVQAALLSEGLLRTETAPEDAPFTDRNLTENFLRIALFEEYAGGQVTPHSSAAPIRLLRWQAPVRVKLVFGPAVPARQQATDRAVVASYLARLARDTGHPISLDDRAPNFWLHFATVDERAAIGPALNAEMPGLTPGQVASVTDMDEGTYCQVLTQSDDTTFAYVRAVAVIPSEHPDLMRLACIHEELAQSLGLPNDSNAARPSIFNDDQEFALLTAQDELMLRILYDPALKPGMTRAEARPIVETLASRLTGGNS
ncbi:MAG: hypothetical protein B7Y02_09550 [Rhodobacterales bacterium 17-64-5]|nr:MAG: hypothetical protein B7Y02_09550 [Rhodobacterales bacterium 17-64-5]